MRLEAPHASRRGGELLKVGDCMVDLPLREVRISTDRAPTRITPKSLAVLLVLVENPKRVVSRAALLSEVWPNTMPTNDVVTQAITQLRKAFGDRSGGPRYIETIAKSGYRLLPSVEWCESLPVRLTNPQRAPKPHQQTAASLRLSPRWILASVALGLLSLGITRFDYFGSTHRVPDVPAHAQHRSTAHAGSPSAGSSGWWQTSEEL